MIEGVKKTGNDYVVVELNQLTRRIKIFPRYLFFFTKREYI